VVQSPKYNRDTFITTALSYDPSNNITSGFLGYTYSRESDDEDYVISCLKQCATLAIHPMLLPSIILRFWCHYYHDKLDSSRMLLRIVEEQNGKLEKEYTAIQDSEGKSTDQEGEVIKSQYHETHEILDREYKFLWSENFHFVRNLSSSCLQALAIITSFRKQTRKDARGEGFAQDGWIEREINGHLLHLDGTVDAYEQRRERMLKRMEITFDEVR
jgi:hypothetical protein